MKFAFLFALALAGVSVAAEARPLDTRSMTCEQVRSVVRASGVRGVGMYTQFGYSNVFAPRARDCHWQDVAEGAFVRTKDLPGPRRCAAGWTCVRRRDHDRR
jgi:hypothetical protein